MKNITKNKKINNFERDLERVNHVYANVFCKLNNTIITITKVTGEILIWTTCAKAGFKNSKKSLPISAQKSAEFIGKRMMKFGVKFISIFLKGMGYGREPTIKGFYNSGLKIIIIADNTSIPHNGCRGKKLRRI